MKEFITSLLGLICWITVMLPVNSDRFYKNKLYVILCKSFFVFCILILGIYAYINEGEDTLRFTLEKTIFLFQIVSLFFFMKALDEKSGKLKVYGYGIGCSLCVILSLIIY